MIMVRTNYCVNLRTQIIHDSYIDIITLDFATKLVNLENLVWPNAKNISQAM